MTIPCATVPHMTIHAVAMNGTRVGTNVQLTFIIYQQVTYQNTSNSVHNSENYICNDSYAIYVRSLLV